MKKSYLFIGLATISMGFFAFQSSTQMTESIIASKVMHAQSGGGQPALTGAPGEGTCTNCHSGTVQDGSQENVFVAINAQFQPVTSYNPGDTYTISVDMVSDPAKKGFSATALDPSDNMAGSFTESALLGTQDFSSGGRDYVSHTGTSNTSATQVWGWTWTAPATNVGDVTFYVASNAANNDGSTAGDIIYLSEHILGSVASVNEEEIAEASFTAGYNSEENKVIIDFTSLTSGKMFFNLVDMTGKSVYSKSMSSALVGENKNSVMLPSSIDNGMYVVNFFVGNKAMSANILVQK
jgi:hypothetical protein